MDIEKTRKECYKTAKEKGSWDKVKKEIDKCMLVCANCHREIHYN